MWRIELRTCNFPPPCNVGCARDEQGHGKYRQWEGRRIEDVRSPPILIPPNQFFRSKTERHQCKLQIEPVWLEPEEQIDAEDHRKRSETKSEDVASRPGQQHVER